MAAAWWCGWTERGNARLEKETASLLGNIMLEGNHELTHALRTLEMLNAQATSIEARVAQVVAPPPPEEAADHADDELTLKTALTKLNILNGRLNKSVSEIEGDVKN